MTFSQIRQYIKGLLSNIFNKSLSNIAPKFDKTKTYAIGDRVIYNGDLYQFTSAHTGTWVAADANKTDINTFTERMPSGDMEEVASPLPGVMSRRMKYSLQEQVVGEWIDGKPLYQKTVELNNPSKCVRNQIGFNILGIKTMSLYAIFDAGNVVMPYYYRPQDFFVVALGGDHTSIFVDWASGAGTYLKKIVATFQYTKTTDTAS